ncbi:integral membrane protein MviN [Anopheles sinensis]|uniref:Integral membrane protein MviN n=1 Tax=Anopheles sinensis TaxID=74873 RepID=A0A084VKF6_ANOSI|nr:integral membrane protein MviN [Anopheles sinensis]
MDCFPAIETGPFPAKPRQRWNYPVKPQLNSATDVCGCSDRSEPVNLPVHGPKDTHNPEHTHSHIAPGTSGADPPKDTDSIVHVDRRTTVSASGRPGSLRRRKLRAHFYKPLRVLRRLMRQQSLGPVPG